VVGRETTAGKTLGRDLALGKPTLPTIHCLAHGEPAVAKRLAAVLGNGSTACSAEICECLEQSASIEYAIGQARRHVSWARRQLEPLPPCPARDALASLAEFIVHRQS
jgi:geranylgeranyl pyrophosphate synthase